MSHEHTFLTGEIEQTLTQILKKAKKHPVSLRQVLRETARETEFHKGSAVASILQRMVTDGRVLEFPAGTDPHYYLAENLTFLEDRLLTLLRNHHSRYPYEPAAKTGDIRKSFSETQTMNTQRNIDTRLFNMVLSACKQKSLIIEAESGIRLADFTPLTTQAPEALLLQQKVYDYVCDNEFSRVTDEIVAAQFSIEPRRARVILEDLTKTSRLLRVADERYFSPETMDQLQNMVVDSLKQNNTIHISQFLEMFGKSRNGTIPVLEYFDRNAITRRVGDLRQLGKNGLKLLQERPHNQG